MLIAPISVYATLGEVLIDFAVKAEVEFSESATEISAVRQRVFIEIRSHRRIYGDCTARNVPAARGKIRHYCRNRLAKVFPQRLIADKKESLVLLYRSAKAATKLVALEFRFTQSIEEIAGIKIVVAMKQIEAAVIVVGT